MTSAIIATLRSKPLYTSAHRVREICRPLFDEFGIDYFTYTNNHVDGSHIRLTTEVNFIERFYSEQFFLDSYFELNPYFFTSGHVLWSDLRCSTLFSGLYDLGIQQGISFIRRNRYSCDFYHFGCKNVEQDLSQHLDVFKRFIFYFREQSADVLKQYNKSRILFDSPHTPQCQFYKTKLSKVWEEFIHNISQQHESLSIREQQCLIYLSFGKTVEEIAMILSISKRTAEDHVKRLKLKLDCQTLFELGAKFNAVYCLENTA